MGYGRFVGRVGMLAVALGIGVAVPAVAIADTDADDTGGTAVDAGGAGADSSAASGSTTTPGSRAGTPSMEPQSSGGAGTSSHADTKPPGTTRTAGDGDSAVPGSGAFTSGVAAHDEQSKPKKKPRSRSAAAKGDNNGSGAAGGSGGQGQRAVAGSASSDRVGTGGSDTKPAAVTGKATGATDQGAATVTMATMVPDPTATTTRSVAAPSATASAPLTVAGLFGVLSLAPNAPAGVTPLTALLWGAHRRTQEAEEDEQAATPKAMTTTGQVVDLTVAAASPAPASAQFSVTDNWGSGFVGNVNVAAGQSALDGWTVEFDSPAQIVNIWNGEIASRTGNHYVVRNASWNGQVAAGQSTSFGFEATPGGAQAVITNLVVNGKPSGQPTLPSVSIANASVAEGNSGTRNLAFTVTLSNAATGPVTVNYATADGTATAGQDYTAKTGSVTFAAGETSKTVTVAVAGDSTVEPNETLTVTLANPNGATIAVASATGTITNDDMAPQPGTTAQWGNAFFAPYVDMAAYPVPNLLEISKATGATLLTLGFIQADPAGNPAWAGLSALQPNSTHEQALAINKSIADFRAAGGDVMISFGGASNTPLWQSYAARGLSAQELANTYVSIVDTYGVTHLDFDIEGAAVSDQPSLTLNSQALNLLQQARPGLQIWYTLPVLPSGLTADGVNVVETALKNGVKLDGVNVMAMNFGVSPPPASAANPKTMGAYAIESGESTYRQLTSLFAKYGQTFSWSQLGVTPLLGVNDIPTEVFTLADAQMVENWAVAKGLGMLSMWSVNRDKPGSFGQSVPYESGINEPANSFSRLFSSYGTQNVVNHGTTGGGTGGGGTPVEGGTTTTIGWQWGTNTVLDFDPAKDKLDFVWMQADQFAVTEESGSTRITIANNNQTYTLQGVALSQLQINNIVAKDAGTVAKWHTIINGAKSD